MWSEIDNTLLGIIDNFNRKLELQAAAMNVNIHHIPLNVFPDALRLSFDE
jgi:hypothetical protein